jgi:hypothetical protein
MCPYNGITCETCHENDLQARTSAVVNGLCDPLDTTKEKEKQKEKEKRTRLPDKFNHHGKLRVSRQDKHLRDKLDTFNKKRERAMLRRIKYDVQSLKCYTDLIV